MRPQSRKSLPQQVRSLLGKMSSSQRLGDYWEKKQPDQSRGLQRRAQSFWRAAQKLAQLVPEKDWPRLFSEEEMSSLETGDPLPLKTNRRASPQQPPIPSVLAPLVADCQECEQKAQQLRTDLQVCQRQAQQFSQEENRCQAQQQALNQQLYQMQLEMGELQEAAKSFDLSRRQMLQLQEEKQRLERELARLSDQQEILTQTQNEHQQYREQQAQTWQNRLNNWAQERQAWEEERNGFYQERAQEQKREQEQIQELQRMAFGLRQELREEHDTSEYLQQLANGLRAELAQAEQVRVAAYQALRSAVQDLFPESVPNYQQLQNEYITRLMAEVQGEDLES